MNTLATENGIPIGFVLAHDADKLEKLAADRHDAELNVPARMGKALARKSVREIRIS